MQTPGKHARAMLFHGFVACQAPRTLPLVVGWLPSGNALLLAAVCTQESLVGVLASPQQLPSHVADRRQFDSEFRTKATRSNMQLHDCAIAASRASTCRTLGARASPVLARMACSSTSPCCGVYSARRRIALPWPWLASQNAPCAARVPPLSLAGSLLRQIPCFCVSIETRTRRWPHSQTAVF